MSDPLLAPTFLFRFSAPCFYEPEPSFPGPPLGQQHVLPSFAELEDRRPFADLRAAWNEQGLVFQLRVVGKKQPAWCRESRVEDSDGLQVWIDTRDTQNVHRASRFCHRFAFLPAGRRRHELPVATWLPINRARENPARPPAGALRVESRQRVDGYWLVAHVSHQALTGFDPDEHPRLGFTYAVVDRELGWQTWSVGPEFPFAEDPSLWGSLELTRTRQKQ